MIYMPALTICIIITVLLIIQTLYDIKKGKLLVSATGMIALMSLHGILSGTLPLSACLLGAAILFVIYFLAAVFGKGGGGDALLLGALGAVLGFHTALYLVLFSSICLLIFAIIYFICAKIGKKKDGEKERLPFAPFVLSGWIALIIYYILKGGIDLWR